MSKPIPLNDLKKQNIANVISLLIPWWQKMIPTPKDMQCKYKIASYCISSFLCHCCTLIIRKGSFFIFWSILSHMKNWVICTIPHSQPGKWIFYWKIGSKVCNITWVSLELNSGKWMLQNENPFWGEWVGCGKQYDHKIQNVMSALLIILI